MFQKSYTGNILEIGRNKSRTSRNSPKLPENRKGDGMGATRAPHNRAARPGPWPRHLCVRSPWTTPDDAPSPIKTPRRKKPKYPITFPEHIVIRRRRRPKDREGPEALPDTLPKRGIAIRGLLHRHACLWGD
jgi:hypothetical protein